MGCLAEVDENHLEEARLLTKLVVGRRLVVVVSRCCPREVDRPLL